MFHWRECHSKTISDYQMTTHLFGKIDSPCCSNFALKRSVLDKADVLNPSSVTSVDIDFYMSHSSIKYLANVTTFVASSLTGASFRLTKFTSNSQAIIDLGHL